VPASRVSSRRNRSDHHAERPRVPSSSARPHTVSRPARAPSAAARRHECGECDALRHLPEHQGRKRSPGPDRRSCGKSRELIRSRDPQGCCYVGGGRIMRNAVPATQAASSPQVRRFAGPI
jgi:hypothetical protein